MDKQVPLESRFLVISILAFTAGAGAGFLGGGANARGNLDVPILNTPIKVGLTGGIAVMVIIFILGSYLYPSKIDDKQINERLIEIEKKMNNEKGVKVITSDSIKVANNDGSPIESSNYTKYWEKGKVLKINFLDGNTELIEFVKQVAKEWVNVSDVDLNYEFVSDALASDIRVSFVGNASWSFIGTQALEIPKDEPTINLGSIKYMEDLKDKRFAVLHEFGHVLGLIHEHQSPGIHDEWNWDEIFKTYQTNFDWTEETTKETINRNLETMNTDDTFYKNKIFDPASVMLYNFPSNFFKKPIQLIKTDELSEGDLELVKNIY